MFKIKYFKVITLIILVFITAYIGFESYRIRRDHFNASILQSFLKADLTDNFDESLSHYYVHTSGQGLNLVESGMYSIPPFDENGVPVVNYGAALGKQYNPTTIAQFALESWELFLQSNDRKYYDIFIKQADWLVKNQHDGKWYYDFDLPARFQKKPWLSSISQGQGISVLLRAYQSTGAPKYLQTAEKAFDIMTLPINDGGVLYQNNSGFWFEEYPNASQPSHVMNGHVWALFGLWDLYRVTGDKRVYAAFEQGVAALKADLNKYDVGYWVLYDQQSKFQYLNANYLNFEINQLKALNNLTNEKTFLDYAIKWESYQHNTNSFLHLLWNRMTTQKFETLSKKLLS